MNIRYYKKTDYPQVAATLKNAGLFDKDWDSEDNLKSMIEKDSKSILVAKVDNTIVGNILIRPYGDKITTLFRLAVRKEYRKQGIASELLKKAQEIAKERKAVEVGFYVDSKNKSLIDFYKKRGFTISKKSYNYMWVILK